MDEQKTNQPRGFILRLHKYYNPPKEHFDKTGQYVKKYFESQENFTTFGNFDQMSFSPVMEFADYRETDVQDYTWLGNRQSVLLYPISTASRRLFGYQDGHFGVVDERGYFSEIKSNYLLITLLYTDSGAKAALKSYDCFLNYCRDAIYAIADRYNSNVAKQGKTLGCEVFGTFNSAEMAIIWTADEFIDALYLIDHLRYLTLRNHKGMAHRAFISSHTFVALTKANINSGSVHGGALIQLAGRTSAGIDQTQLSGYDVMLNYVENVGRVITGDRPDNATHMYCTGEYDLIFQTDQKYLSKLFQETGQADSSPEFSIQNAAFSAHVLESATRLYYKKEDVEALDKAMKNDWVTAKDASGQITAGLLDVAIRKEDQSQYSSSRMEITERITRQDDSINDKYKNNYTLFQDLLNSAAKIAQASPMFHHTLYLAYIDYVQCITTAVDHLWVKDFDSQFHASLSILLNCNRFVVSKLRDPHAVCTISPSDYLEVTQNIFHSLQQQCYHVVDSGKFFLEEPSSHYSYTGQYDLMMHAYYGILKCLLERMYIPARPQSQLYPLINFEPTPILSSKLYLETMDDQPNDSPVRLLVIKLPYNDAWTRLDHYIPMLIHELYHYAAPRSRIHRNYYFGCIALTWMHSHMFDRCFQEIIQQERNSALLDGMKYCLLNRVEQTLSNQFGEILRMAAGSSEAGSFQTKYVNYLLSLIEEHSSHYDSIMKRIANALADDLSKYKESDEWEDKFKHISPQEKESLDEEFIQIITLLRPQTKDAQDKLLSYYNSLLQQEVTDSLLPMMDVLKELFPDVAMVELAGLDAVGYLLQFTIDQNNQLLVPEDMPPQNSIRIGCVLDWILGCLPENKNDDTLTLSDCIAKLEKVRDRFLKLYKRIYKTAPQIGEQWFDYYVKAYRDYIKTCCIYTKWLSPLIRNEFLPCLKTEAHSENLHLLTSLCKEYYCILENDNDDDRKSALFNHTIKMVQSFQVQKSLEEIQLKKPEYEPLDDARVPLHSPDFSFGRNNPLTDCIWNSYLESAQDLHGHLSRAVQRLREIHQRAFPGSQSYRPWFRGCRNAGFDILPSIMVHFLDDIAVKDFSGKNTVGTLLDYQRKLLEEFKFRADGAPEMLNSSRYQRLDYLALMQHYSQYTGLLDWSEDAYSSLYFALEKFVDNPETEVTGDEDAAAALYIMDPMLYNRARRKMIQTLSTIPEEYERTLQGDEGYVPNLSIKENSEQFSLFIPGTHIKNPHKHFHDVGSAPEETELQDVEKDELYNLPLAIYTSRMNPRLRAQSGMFMSYNLHSVPVRPQLGTNPNNKICSPKLFHYLALESIQRYYLSKFPAEKPFLMKIHIGKQLKRELGDTLRFLGMNRYRIYPELNQLAKK